MTIEIAAVGGYNEVGKNMTAINVNGDVVILDMGLELDSYIKYTEEEDIIRITNAENLMKVGAIADDTKIKDWAKNVRAIIPTHAHLDHVGAVPYLSNHYNAPILCTPYTAAVIKAILRDEKIRIKNKIRVLHTNSVYYLTKNITVEFISITHSTPQAVMVALHTPEGIIIYCNDFKFDLNPTIGKGPDFRKLEAIGKKGVKALIADSTYAATAGKMPSESVARELLKDVLLGVDTKGKGIILTTFASHLARLKSVVELGRKLNRRVVFMGRSLSKYIMAGEEVGLINFSRGAEVIRFRRQIEHRLKSIAKQGRAKYLLVVTGHQGEPKSVLAKMAKGEIDYGLSMDDNVIFSCKVIPTPTNIKNREEVELQLKKRSVRLFTDIHVSGHAAREDLRDLLNLLKPEQVLPTHGDHKNKLAMVELAKETGIDRKNIHMLSNGQRLKLE